MASIVNFPESNITFVAEGCNDLPAWQGTDNNGQNVVISVWELSEEERKQVAETGRVYLWVYGGGQPPVYVGGERPFEVRPVDN